MPATTPVTVDLASGTVRFGARLIRLMPSGRPQHVRVGQAEVRAVGFAERSDAVREAIAADDPPEALMALLRAAAVIGQADGLVDAVLLALAGGGEEAPGYDLCAVAVAHRSGWSWQALAEAPALEVDRLAVAPADPGGWSRVVIAPAEPERLEVLVRQMAERLVARGIPAVAFREGAAGASSRPPETHGVRAAGARPGESVRAAVLPLASGNTPASRPPAAGGPEAHPHASAGGVQSFDRAFDAEPRSSTAGDDSAPVRAVGRRVVAGSAVPQVPTHTEAGAGGIEGRAAGRWLPAAVVATAVPATNLPAASSSHERTGWAETGPDAVVPWPWTDGPLPRPATPWPAAGIGTPAAGASAAGRVAAAAPPEATVEPAVSGWRGHDPLEALARALADECDLRGIDA